MNAPTLTRNSANETTVKVDGVTYWFSYDTCVAFRLRHGSLIVHENEWGPTTAKHLNHIDGGAKDSRVDHETFMRLLADMDVLDRALLERVDV